MKWAESLPAILLMAVSGAACGQAYAPCCVPANGAPNANDVKELPPQPTQGPDLLKQYRDDPAALKALRQQARQNDKLRQTQVVKATDLLLKLTQDLRVELAAKSSDVTAATETELLKEIQKLARVIQEKERAENEVSSDLAKAGMWP